jgi:hypothetical protein
MCYRYKYQNTATAAGLETQHVSSRWCYFYFYFIFITLFYILFLLGLACFTCLLIANLFLLDLTHFYYLFICLLIANL